MSHNSQPAGGKLHSRTGWDSLGKGGPKHAELNASLEIAHIPMGACPNK